MKALLKELSLGDLVDEGPGEMEEEGDEMGGQVNAAILVSNIQRSSCCGSSSSSGRRFVVGSMGPLVLTSS